MKQMRRNRADEQWLGSHILFLLPFSLQFHYERTQAQFFVEDASVAFALEDVKGKIWDEANERVRVKGMAGAS